MRHDEESLQSICVTWFSLQYPEMAQLLHHSPNGGRRNAREGARFKAMGVRAGFPDLQLCVARGRAHGLFIEMKAGTGRQSTSQKKFQELLTAQGYRYCLCRGFEEFREIITGYLNNNK